METLNLPTYSFKIKSEGERKYIFDNLRKKYVALTPEEWVRQNFIRYLINEKGFPAGLIGVEQAFRINQLSKRCDIIIYANTGEPLLIVECKSFKTEITQKTFDQIARYNIRYEVKYLVVTNGMNHYCCMMDYEKNNYSFLDYIPDISNA